MNISNLLKGYNVKGIKATSTTLENKIKFTKNIYASYYQKDNEITNIKVIADIKSSMQHNVTLMKVVAYTIDLLSNNTIEERNNLMKMLGMLNGDYVKGQGVSDDANLYVVEVFKGLFMFSIVSKDISDIEESILEGEQKETPAGLCSLLCKEEI